MILDRLYCDNIIFEDVVDDSHKICVLTRPIYEIEVNSSFNSMIYTSNEIKSVLTKKLNNIPDKFIVTVPFNQWTDLIKIQGHQYRLAGIDLETISLHFMVLIENVTSNEIYLYTGDFFTIEKLEENEFFTENKSRINKIFFDNKTIKYDLKTYMDILSTYIKQTIDNYSFAIFLPHLGYEDFLAALIKNFKMTIHVNELRKFILQKSKDMLDVTFIDKDGIQPKLIVHSRSKSLHEIKTLYKKYKICTLSFSHLNEFSSTAPKIVDYSLMMLLWDQHPTESMVIKLFDMLPQNVEVNSIYNTIPCSRAIIEYIISRDSISDMSDDMFSLDINEAIESDEILVSQINEFSPHYFSTQLPKDNRPIPIEVNHIIANVSDNLQSNSEESEGTEMNTDINIDDYRDLDLGNLFKYLRYVGKKQ